MRKNYGAMYDQLKFTDDFMFCKILENNPEICKELLEVILGIKIKKVESVSKQKEIRVKSDGKGVRFDLSLPVYHFENACMENTDLLLDDETEKIFVNSKGIRENISEEMKAFLDFLEDKQSNSHLTKRLQEELENARRQEEWRHEYMTLAERDEEKREEGRQEGIKEGIKEGIMVLVESLREVGLSEEVIVQKLMEKFKLSEEETKAYL